MAYLVTNNTFKPYSFEEMLKPYQLYGEAYREQEAAYDEALKQASQVDIGAFTDQSTIDTYNNYVNSLKDMASYIGSKGIDFNTRKGLSDAKNEYWSRINPMIKAVDEYNRALDYRDKIKASTKGAALFVNDYLTADSFLNGAKADNTYIDLDRVTSGAADIGKVYAKMERGEGTINDLKNLPGYKEYKQKYGWSDDDIKEAFNNNADGIISDIIENLRSENSYNKFNKDQQTIIDASIYRGLQEGVNSSKTELVQDRSYMDELDRERYNLLKEQVAEAKASREGQLLPDGKRVFNLPGGNYLIYDKDGNLVENSNTPKDTSETKLSEDLTKVTKVGDMKKLGYEAVGTVVRESNQEYNLPYGVLSSWTGGISGQDEHLRGTKTNLYQGKINWKYSYDPQNNAELHVVTDPTTIPGYNEYLSGTKDEATLSKTAFGKIMEQALSAGITPEQFNSSDVQIIKVKARGKRAQSNNESWDYIIFRKS